MELSKQEIVEIQCAIHEAIGLNTDQAFSSTDPTERRALEANIAVYRRALQKLRMLEAQATGTNTKLSDAGLVRQTISDLARDSKRAKYLGETVFVADTAEQESQWRALCKAGHAIEVSRSMFQALSE